MATRNASHDNNHSDVMAAINWRQYVALGVTDKPFIETKLPRRWKIAANKSHHTKTAQDMCVYFIHWFCFFFLSISLAGPSALRSVRSVVLVWLQKFGFSSYVLFCDLSYYYYYYYDKQVSHSVLFVPNRLRVAGYGLWVCPKVTCGNETPGATRKMERCTPSKSCSYRAS